MCRNFQRQFEMLLSFIRTVWLSDSKLWLPGQSLGQCLTSRQICQWILTLNPEQTLMSNLSLMNLQNLFIKLFLLLCGIMKKCWRYDFRSAFVIFAALLVSGCHGVDREPIRSPAAANQRAHQELGRGRGFRVEWLLRRGTTHTTLNLMSWRWTFLWMFLFLQLDEMCITFDGGKTRLNFAEAALLIQGSTCIYSKKVNYVNPVCRNSPKCSQWLSVLFFQVELLHSLVYQTLEYINDKNRKYVASCRIQRVFVLEIHKLMFLTLVLTDAANRWQSLSTTNQQTVVNLMTSQW